MKLISKVALLSVGLVMSVSAFANLVGNWQTYEDGKPKAVVKITESGGVYTGVIISGNTEKAKQHIGKTVITGLKENGSGKYSGGKITDPVNGKTYSLAATLNGNTLKLRGYIGAKALGRTQTWQKK
ncbi:MAG: DUF2147 domain-containing protein [Moraxella sp.]|nr:DUF2147 domain-containing protein [Moraxella sp.]